MTDVIDLAGERMRRETSYEYRSCDRNGEPLYRFIFQYRHNNSVLDFDIWAHSEKDAEDRLKSIRDTAWVEGRLICSVR